jgi:PBP1b-binding outer membrane lipoprotein LpoB
MGKFKIKTLLGIATSIALLTGCSSTAVAPSENLIPEPEKLTTKEACKEFDSEQKFLAEFLDLVLTELEGSSPRKKRLERLGAEIVEAADPLLGIKVEEVDIENEIVSFATDMSAFGQTFVDGYDFFKDDQPVEALEDLQISTIKTLDACGLS